MRWPCALVVGLALAAQPPQALADADEASIGVQAVGGTARVGERLVDDESAIALLLGLSARTSFARSNHVQWEASLAFTEALTSRFEDVAVMGMNGHLERRHRLARAGIGAALRLGVRYIPILRVELGSQVRQLGNPRLVAQGQRVPIGRSQWLFDLTVAASLGFDYRANRRWVIGASVSAVHAFPLGGPAWDAAQGGLHLSYYWYPRW